ncbi:hypothetical protein P154DRAFT_573855 [Amniculicola lignicola CBS 123094]|uniref:Uncharacterized protein n=1 Tax=Amniculicola lignicola CBS 123094 TaxID=1392246 RepID=A0A6A5WR27_9PLEO|nr:hypothetical protein P154DRAFT_573855 [Amniculicola lignicola CBS 123094]
MGSGWLRGAAPGPALPVLGSVLGSAEDARASWAGGRAARVDARWNAGPGRRCWTGRRLALARVLGRGGRWGASREREQQDQAASTPARAVYKEPQDPQASSGSTRGRRGAGAAASTTASSRRRLFALVAAASPNVTNVRKTWGFLVSRPAGSLGHNHRFFSENPAQNRRKARIALQGVGERADSDGGGPDHRAALADPAWWQAKGDHLALAQRGTRAVSFTRACQAGVLIGRPAGAAESRLRLRAVQHSSSAGSLEPAANQSAATPDAVPVATPQSAVDLLARTLSAHSRASAAAMIKGSGL